MGQDCADQTPGCVDSHQLNYDLDTDSKAQVQCTVHTSQPRFFIFYLIGFPDNGALF